MKQEKSIQFKPGVTIIEPPKQITKIHGSSKYTKEIAMDICNRLIQGESLKSICKLKEYPTEVTIFSWLNKGEKDLNGEYGSFLKLYTRAKQEQSEGFIDEIVAIADDPNIDANQKKVMIDARKWTASKLKPQKYGDRLDLNHGAQGSFADMMNDLYKDKEE